MPVRACRSVACYHRQAVIAQAWDAAFLAKLPGAAVFRVVKGDALDRAGWHCSARSRGYARPESNVDFLVTFQPGAQTSV